MTIDVDQLERLPLTAGPGRRRRRRRSSGGASLQADTWPAADVHDQSINVWWMLSESKRMPKLAHRSAVSQKAVERGRDGFAPPCCAGLLARHALVGGGEIMMMPRPEMLLS